MFTKLQSANSVAALFILLNVGILHAQVPPVGPTTERCPGGPCRNVPASPVYTPPSPAESAYSDGLRARDAQQWEEAGKAFRRAFDLETNKQRRLDILGYLANALIRSGRLDEAIIAARTGFQMDSDQAEIKSTLVNLLIQKLSTLKRSGHEEGAEAVYLEALKLAPTNTDVRSWVSWIEEIRTRQRVRNIITAPASTTTDGSVGFVIGGRPVSQDSNSTLAVEGAQRELRFAGLDSFPGGNKDVVPPSPPDPTGNSGLSQPDKNKALGDAKAAKAEGEVEGQSVVFDKGRVRGDDSADVVDVSNIGSVRTIPAGLAQSPEFQKLQAREKANRQEAQQLDQELAKVRAQKEKPGADRKTLDMQEFQLKDRIFKTKYAGKLIQKEIDQKIQTYNSYTIPNAVKKPEGTKPKP